MRHVNENVVKIVTKVWGSEEIVASNHNYNYSGKKMFLHKGGCCSTHFHRFKCETFYVNSGHMALQYWEPSGKRTTKILEAGDSFTIDPCTPHRFYGIDDCTFFEFSTYDSASDSFRLDSSSMQAEMPDTMKEDLEGEK